jgi:hypothetical protein
LQLRADVHDPESDTRPRLHRSALVRAPQPHRVTIAPRDNFIITDCHDRGVTLGTVFIPASQCSLVKFESRGVALERKTAIGEKSINRVEESNEKRRKESSEQKEAEN